jgi:hypothetical protein
VVNTPAPPVISLSFALEVRDRQGRVVASHRAPSRSYVRAFLDWLYAMLATVAVTLIPDTGGTNRTCASQAVSNFMAGDDISVQGPVVGTGTNAVAILDNKLQFQINHGVVANTLDHQATERLGLSTVGSTRQFVIRRLFVNASGGTITVNECGIYSSFGGWNFCFIRDLVSPGVAIPNGGTGTLIYTISISV